MRKPVVLGITFVWASLFALTLTARTAKKTVADYRQFETKLSKDEQVLHVLDRLTYGPRPGDIDAVKKMGLKKWIDLQLHPDRIPENAALEAKLAPLESLRMTQSETASNYPTQQTIRAIAEGRQPLPEDPVARAAVERLARRYKVRKDAAAGVGTGAGADPFEPAIPLDQLLSRDEIRTLRNGTAEQKKELLASIPENQLDDVVISMPPPMRNQLMAAAPAVLRRKLMQSNQPQQVIFSTWRKANCIAPYMAIASLRSNWWISGTTTSTCS